MKRMPRFSLKGLGGIKEEDIGVFVDHVLKPYYRTDECVEKIRGSLNSGWLGPGQQTANFENSWQREMGFKNSLFVNSNTSGLHLAFESLKRHENWAGNSEVVTSPLTFVATNHSILYSGLTPVFADIDESLCLDPKIVESRITNDTRAVVYVGIGGNAANYYEVKEICRQYRLALIVDAAHMAGTRTSSGDHVGLDADATVFSFQAVKNLPTADSGVVCFKSACVQKIARRLSWMGIDKSTAERSSGVAGYQWDYSVDELGFKYNGNAIMASIAEVGLQYLEEDNQYRRWLASIYDRLLSDVPSIKTVAHDSRYVSSRHLYQVIVQDRPQLVDHLRANGVGYGVHYRDNTLYSLYRGADGMNPLARFYSESVLSLPLHLHLSEEDVVYVCRALREGLN